MRKPGIARPAIGGTMSSNAYDIQVPATEVQIAEAIRVSDPAVADVIRRLAFERDKLKEQLANR